MKSKNFTNKDFTTSKEVKSIRKESKIVKEKYRVGELEKVREVEEIVETEEIKNIDTDWTSFLNPKLAKSLDLFSEKCKRKVSICRSDGRVGIKLGKGNTDLHNVDYDGKVNAICIRLGGTKKLNQKEVLEISNLAAECGFGGVGLMVSNNDLIFDLAIKEDMPTKEEITERKRKSTKPDSPFIDVIIDTIFHYSKWGVLIKDGRHTHVLFEQALMELPK